MLLPASVGVLTRRSHRPERRHWWYGRDSAAERPGERGRILQGAMSSRRDGRVRRYVVHNLPQARIASRSGIWAIAPKPRSLDRGAEGFSRADFRLLPCDQLSAVEWPRPCRSPSTRAPAIRSSSRTLPRGAQQHDVPTPAAVDRSAARAPTRSPYPRQHRVHLLRGRRAGAIGISAV